LIETAVDGCSLANVQSTVREFAANIEVAGSRRRSSSSSEQALASGGMHLAESAKQRQTLIEWSACLQHILHETDK
jgi:hypothetical protein